MDVPWCFTQNAHPAEYEAAKIQEDNGENECLVLYHSRAHRGMLHGQWHHGFSHVAILPVQHRQVPSRHVLTIAHMCGMSLHLARSPRAQRQPCPAVPRMPGGGSYAELALVKSVQPELGPDVTKLSASVRRVGCDTLRLTLRDADEARWEVPTHLFKSDILAGVMMAGDGTGGVQMGV